MAAGVPIAFQEVLNVSLFGVGFVAERYFFCVAPATALEQ